MLLNVETAYWALYGAYWNLYARETGLRFAYETYKILKAKYQAGREASPAFYQTLAQYEQFRAQRISAIQRVLEAERTLRGLLNLPVDDGMRLMPSDAPTLAPYRPDWSSAEADALAHRPELFLTRQEIKAAQMNVLLAQNSLLPDVRFTSTWDWNGIGNRLDGPDNNNAFRSIADGNFHSWSAGIRATVPLGFRSAHAGVRQAQLRLAQGLALLQDQEERTRFALTASFQELASSYETIRAQRAQRQALGEQLRARSEEVDAGRATLNALL